jgi:hypothetical protein
MAEVRTGQGSVKLTREEFAQRFHERFYDPSFDDGRAELDRLVEIAWSNYEQYRKSPAVQDEVRQVARAVAVGVRQLRAGQRTPDNAGTEEVRPKEPCAPDRPPAPLGPS